MRFIAVLKAGGMRLLPFVLASGLGSCAPLERFAQELTDEIGLPLAREDGLSHLPLERWLTRDTIRVGGIAFCRKGECAAPVAVLAVEASGEDAREIAAVMADPQRLGRFFNRRHHADVTAAKQRRRPGPQAMHSVVSALDSPHGGFALTMAGSKGRTAEAIVLVRRHEGGVRLVIAVAETRAAALGAAHGRAKTWLQAP